MLLHSVVAVGFAALAAVWSYPLVLHLTTHLPGTGVGDNAIFLWNFWWMRKALASGVTFFHTTYLFAPVGADLTLHSHTALPAWVGATLLGRLSPITALNLTTLVSLALNGFSAYLLAWRLVRQRWPAILAGVIFGTSPYIAAHLNGHFNLTTAWTIPVFALCVVELLRGSKTWAVIGGLTLAATAYIDYYYVIYEFALAGTVVFCAAWQCHIEPQRDTWSPRWVTILVAGVILLDVVVLVAIWTTGGFSSQVGPVRVSARDVFNPLQFLWLLIAIAVWLRVRPRLSVRPRDGWSPRGTLPSLALLLGVFLLLSAPVLWNGLQLILRGEYVTQQYYWRNAPIGIDAATVVLGSPFHGVWGGGIQHLYSRMGIDLIESGAWLGIAPVILALCAVRSRQTDPTVRVWATVGCVFFVWALGSHLHLAGRNTGLILPEVLLRFVPIAANARMPGRAMVLVYLALGILAAIGVGELKWKRAVALQMCVVALVFADFLIAPFPLVSVHTPAIYQVLRDRPERGALVELPLGVGDGFGEITPVDHRVFIYQTIHERPLVGGVLARMPSGVLAAYRSDPLIAAWLRLSARQQPNQAAAVALPDSGLAAQRMQANGIGFVMLRHLAAAPRLRQYVQRELPLTLIADDGERALYLVTPSRAVR